MSTKEWTALNEWTAQDLLALHQDMREHWGATVKTLKATAGRYAMVRLPEGYTQGGLSIVTKKPEDQVTNYDMFGNNMESYSSALRFIRVLNTYDNDAVDAAVQALPYSFNLFDLPTFLDLGTEDQQVVSTLLYDGYKFADAVNAARLVAA